MFGRATITLGIGLHSSFSYSANKQTDKHNPCQPVTDVMINN